MPDIPEKLSPLHQIHTDAGANFTDFAGWQMPLKYTSDLAEHHAVRTTAGIFDISHMAEISVRGSDAGAFLDYALAGKLSGLQLMQAKYTLLLTEHGGIVDDLIVYRNGDAEYLVVANAGNHDPVLAALTDRAAQFPEASVTDMSAATALIAVQGPNALNILEATHGLTVLAGQQPFADLKYYRATGATFGYGTVFVARTGYTGEDGFELYVETSDAEKLWHALTTAGGDHGLVPAGLASRDTLRLEAGMPLYGHELGLDIRPAQAGLGRVVNLSKEGDFVGRDAIEGGSASDAPVLVGLTGGGKRAARAGYEVHEPGDAPGGSTNPIGRITSGALSPTLGHPIALAFVQPAFAEPGTDLAVDVRGTRTPFTVTPLPFYRRKKN